MEKEKLTIKELLNAIHFLMHSISSRDNIHTYFESGAHKLIFKEMNKFSKEELENAYDSRAYNYDMREPGCLYNFILTSVRNPLLFSVLLKKGAFENKLCEETKWILKNFPQPSFDLYDCLYEIERHRKYKNANLNSSNYDSSLCLLLNFCTENEIDFVNETIERKNVLNKILEELLEKNSTELIEYAYNNLEKKPLSGKMILQKCMEKNIDIKKNYLLDKYLPKDKGGSFFISSMDTPKIKTLLQSGLRFNEENYEYNNMNLFMAVATSKRKDLIEMFLPYLSYLEPKNEMTMDEQKKLLEDKTMLINSETKQFIIFHYTRIMMDRMKNKINNSIEEGSQSVRLKI